MASKSCDDEVPAGGPGCSGTGVEAKSSDQQVLGGGSDGDGEVAAVTGGSSQYESQHWKLFSVYLEKIHNPPLSLATFRDEHVIEFLKYLEHVIEFFKYLDPLPPGDCPLKTAWGSLDAIIDGLRAAYEENGGTPESNPFSSLAVTFYRARKATEIHSGDPNDQFDDEDDTFVDDEDFTFDDEVLEQHSNTIFKRYTEDSRTNISGSPTVPPYRGERSRPEDQENTGIADPNKGPLRCWIGYDMGNTIFKRYPEDSRTNISGSPTVPPYRGERSQPEDQENTGIADPNKMSWWRKKAQGSGNLNLRQPK